MYRSPENRDQRRSVRSGRQRLSLRDPIKKDPKVSFCVFGKDEKRDGDWAYYVKSVVVFGKAQIIEDRDKTAFVSRLISSKFPATDEYVEHEISKFGSSTLCFSIQIESMTGKLVHEA